MRTLWSRARTREDGLGLIELIIAMTILTVGLLAILATFSSGMTALARSSRTANASTLADSQLQLYRALTYCAIRLRNGSIPTTAPYTTPPDYDASATKVTDTAPGNCGASTLTCPAPPSTIKECEATRTVTGPEGRPYRIDTYIVIKPVGALSRETKKVTVVVRDPENGNAVLTRHVSLFDRLLG
jgi:type II secretory pathway pseudopilin PulG